MKDKTNLVVLVLALVILVALAVYAALNSASAKPAEGSEIPVEELEQIGLEKCREFALADEVVLVGEPDFFWGASGFGNLEYQDSQYRYLFDTKGQYVKWIVCKPGWDVFAGEKKDQEVLEQIAWEYVHHYSELDEVSWDIKTNSLVEGMYELTVREKGGEAFYTGREVYIALSETGILSCCQCFLKAGQAPEECITQEQAMSFAENAIIERAEYDIIDLHPTENIYTGKPLEIIIELRYSNKGVYIWYVHTYAVIEDNGQQYMAGYDIQVDNKTGEILEFAWGY